MGLETITHTFPAFMNTLTNNTIHRRFSENEMMTPTHTISFATSQELETQLETNTKVPDLASVHNGSNDDVNIAGRIEDSHVNLGLQKAANPEHSEKGGQRISPSLLLGFVPHGVT
jgi:hypothetical protein